MISISLTTNIRYNLKQFFTKRFLDRGFYTNIKKNDIFYDSGNPSVLVKNGNLFESIANEWVYELDVSQPSGFEAPIDVSGVYVNNTFYANGAAPYGAQPDYLHGCFKFSSPPSSTDVVQAEFSYKDCVVDYDDSTVNNIIQTQYIQNPDFTADIHPSGLDRILPAMIIEPTVRDRRALQIGGGDIISENVSFFIYSAKAYERDAIVDAIYDTVRETISGVDYREAPEILNYSGGRSSNYKTYTQMQNDHFWTKIYIDEMRIIQRSKVNPYIRMARVDLLLKIYIDA